MPEPCPGAREPGGDALRYRLLVEHLGGAVLFQVDAHGRFTRLGAAWEALCGAASAGWLGRSLMEALHPEDRESTRALLDALATRERESVLHEVRLCTPAGHCWVELFARRSPGAPGEVLGTFTDMTERRLAQEALSTRERCLAAVVEVQRRLLAVESWTDLYDAILEPLGRAADASRVYVFESRRDAAGRVRIHQKTRWCAPGVSAAVDNPYAQDFPLEEHLGPDIMALLGGGQPLQALVRELPPPLCDVLGRQGVHAILLLPVRVHGDFFGFIGFDNCVAPRPWRESAVEQFAGGGAGPLPRAR